MVVLNTFNDNNLYDNDDSGDYGYNYNKKNKIKYGFGFGKNDDDYDEGNKFKAKSPMRNEKTPPRNQKVEMSYLKNRKNEEENSDDDYE